MSEVIVVADGASAAQSTAELFVEATAGAVAARGRGVVALTGGSSAVPLFTALRSDPWRARVPWAQIDWMVGDERRVPETEATSNFGVAQRELFSKAPIDPARLHPMRGDAPDAEAEARRFEAELRALAGDPPRIDLILLGLGPDGHIFSLFAGVPSSAERSPDELVRALAAPISLEPKVPRLSFSPAALITARTVVLQASGAAKADALARALRGPEEILNCPAQWIRKCVGRVVVVADAAAAARL